MRYLLAISLVVFSSSLSTAQEFNVGDTVETDFTAQGTVKAKIVALVNDKYARIKFADRGGDKILVVNISRLRSLRKANDNAGMGDKEFRTWQDKSGKFQIEAKLVSHSKTTVTLEKKDGKQIEVPLDKLSDADQKFVSVGNQPTYATKGVIETNAKDAKVVTFSGELTWDVTPDPITPLVEGPSEIILPSGRFAKPGLIPTFDRERFFVSGPGQGAPDLMLVNFSDGKIIWKGQSQARASNATVPVAVAPNPQLVCYLDSQELLFAHLKASGSIKGIVKWQAFKPKSKNWVYQPSIVRFIGPDHILTASENMGTVVLWDWYNAKAIWRGDFTPGSRPLLTHNQKYLIVHSNDQLCFVEPLTGDVVGRIECRNRGQTGFGLSPDGERLLVSGSSLYRTYDLNTQKDISDQNFNGPFGNIFTSAIGKGRTSSTGRGQRLFMAVHGDRLTLETDGQQLAVRRAKIEPIQRNPEESPGEVKFVLQPGDSIQLDFSATGIADDRKREILDNILQQLASENIKVVNASPKRLVIAMGTGLEGQAKWGFGTHGDNQNYYQAMYYGKKSVRIRNSGLYIGNDVYPNCTLDMTALGIIRSKVARGQEIGEWAPNIIVRCRVPETAKRNNNISGNDPRLRGR